MTGKAAAFAITTPWTVNGQTGDSLGRSVAWAGDVNGDGYADLLVAGPGAGGSAGQVYFYFGNGGGLAATPGLTLTGESGGDAFGTSLAGDGDVNGDGYADFLVGAPGAAAGAGRVYLFLGGGTVSTTAALTVTGVSGEGMGRALAMAGDVNGDGYADFLTGLPDAGGDTGSALLFLGGATLDGTADLTLNGSVAGDSFGAALAGVGDTNGDGYADFAVGAPGVNSDTGRAFLFLGGSALSANPARSYNGENFGHRFGAALAGSGDVNGDGFTDMAVAAPGYSANTGRLYLFHGGPGGPDTTADATRTGSGTGAQLGASLSGAGDVDGDGYADLLIGAPGINSSAGQIFLYYGGATGLSSGVSSLPQNGAGEGGENFGASVAGGGDANGDGFADFAAGGPEANSAGGIARIFLGSGRAPNSAYTAAIDGAGDGARLGRAVALAGDVNGDSFSDLLVGAFGSAAGGANSGRAWLWPGAGAGIVGAAQSIGVGASGDFFGRAVAGVGDVNGDGYADVMVGAPQNDPDTTLGDFRSISLLDPGYAQLYLGSASGLASTPVLTLTGEADNDHFGYAIARLGDVNGDGFADVLISGFKNDAAGADAGRAYLFLGTSTGDGLLPAPVFTATGEAPGDFFGYALAGLGDVNGDGLADAAIGGYTNDAGGADAGRVYIFHGTRSGGLQSSPALTLTGGAAGDLFGFGLAGAGDVNGDGFADLLVGAFGQDGTGDGAGRAWLFYGSGAGINPTGAVVGSGEAAGDAFGYAVAGAGDVNGDGFADLLIGAHLNDAGGDSAGRVYLYGGRSSGPSASPVFTATGQAADDQFGVALSSAGDVNGDGFADLLIGAARHDTGGVNAGRAYLYLGNGGDGRPVLAQHFGGTGNLAQPWGLSGSPDRFRVRLQGRSGGGSSGGRQAVKLQTEACPPGKAFGDVACTVQASSQWTPTGVALPLTVTGLTDNTLYRWRSRLLYAALSVTSTAITPPPQPVHGPWRQLEGRGVESAIRIGFPPQLTIAKTTSAAQPLARGSSFSYQIVVKNQGDGPARDVRVSDNLPASTAFAGWNEQPVGASVADGLLVWSGDIQAGQAVTIGYTLQHTGGYGESLHNQAVFTHTSGVGSASAGVQILGAPVLTGTIRTSDPTPAEGSLVTVTVLFSNTGLSDAMGVRLYAPGFGLDETVPVVAAGATVTRTFLLAAVDGPETATSSLILSATGIAPVTTSPLTIAVQNVPPVIALLGSGSATVGQPYTLTLGAIADPGQDTVSQWLVDWGDGITQTLTSGGDVVHTYAAPGEYAVRVALVDEDGAHDGAGVHSVTATADGGPLTATPTGTPTGTATADGGRMTSTPTATPTVTGAPPTVTPTASTTVTASATPSVTPTATATVTGTRPTGTPTLPSPETATPTATALPGVTPTATPTLPANAGPAGVAVSIPLPINGPAADGVLAVGQQFTLTLLVNNSGETPLAGLPLAFHYDASRLHLLAAAPAPASLADGNIIWDNLLGSGVLLPEDGIGIQMAFVVLGSSASLPDGLAFQTARVTGAQDIYGQVAAPGESRLPLRLTAPQLRLEKRVEGDLSSVEFGSFVTYTIQLTNPGDTLLTRIGVRDIFESDRLRFVDASISKPDIEQLDGHRMLVWDDITEYLGDIPPGGSVVFTVWFLVEGGGLDTTNQAESWNVADAYGDSVLGVSGNASVTVPIAVLDLVVSSTPPAGSPVMGGDRITYTLQISNGGGIDLSAVWLRTQIPEHTEYIPGSALPPAEETRQNVSNLVWRLPGLARNEQFVAQYAVQVEADVQAGSVVNRAEAASNQTPVGREVVVVHTAGPTAIGLLRFVTTVVEEGVLLEWMTGVEVDSWGFHLWRGTSEVFAHSQRVTAGLIPAAGGGGATYRFVDGSAEPGGVYWYWLEEVEGDGDRLFYGPVRSPVSVVLDGAFQLFLPAVER